MTIGTGRLRTVLQHPLWFTIRVLTGFRANQGFLLAGAVAYYTLLSLVPMLALVMILLTQLVELQLLLDTMREYLARAGQQPGRAGRDLPA